MGNHPNCLLIDVEFFYKPGPRLLCVAHDSIRGIVETLVCTGGLLVIERNDVVSRVHDLKATHLEVFDETNFEGDGVEQGEPLKMQDIRSLGLGRDQKGNEIDEILDRLQGLHERTSFLRHRKPRRKIGPPPSERDTEPVEQFGASTSGCPQLDPSPYILESLTQTAVIRRRAAGQIDNKYVLGSSLIIVPNAFLPRLLPR
jgi:hypothetical protein